MSTVITLSGGIYESPGEITAALRTIATATGIQMAAIILVPGCDPRGVFVGGSKETIDFMDMREVIEEQVTLITNRNARSREQVLKEIERKKEQLDQARRAKRDARRGGIEVPSEYFTEQSTEPPTATETEPATPDQSTITRRAIFACGEARRLGAPEFVIDNMNRVSSEDVISLWDAACKSYGWKNRVKMDPTEPIPEKASWLKNNVAAEHQAT